MKAKAYSYVRFSTKDQIKGDSLRRQTAATAEWCTRNGVELCDSYSDLGVSAFRGKNAEVGALSDFLALVRKGKIEKGSYLIVESLDRVSRNEILDALELFTGIIKSGIVLVTLSDNQVYDREKINANPMQLMISLTVMTRAHEESHTKSIRIASAWEAKRRNVGKSKLTGKCPGWLKLSEDKSEFIVIPQNADIVRRMFQMVIEGKGVHNIAKIFHREKVPSFGYSGTWYGGQIKNILTGRSVIGEFTPATKREGKRTFLDPIADYYPAIVKRETYATVQQIRKARPSYKGRSTFNVFSHLAFDEETGSPMGYTNKGRRGKSWHYLVSAHAVRGLSKYCAWQYDDFLSAFLTVCEKAALEPQNKNNPDDGRLELARMELDEAEKQISRLVEFVAKGASASVETKLREVELSKAGLQTKIRDLESSKLAKPSDVSKINWTDRDALRDNLRATVKRITVNSLKKSFQAEFLDGRKYSFEVKDGQAVIHSDSEI